MGTVLFDAIVEVATIAKFKRIGTRRSGQKTSSLGAVGASYVDVVLLHMFRTDVVQAGTGRR